MKTRKFIIVEDERLVAEDIAECLRSRDFEVCAICNNGADAIKAAREHMPDLVMMDIVIQGEMDGIDTATVLREELDIPVVFLTAYSQDGILERAKKVDPLGYVVKPFEEGALLSTVEMALHKARMDRELRQSEEWFSTTLESIGDGVIATDEAGNIKFLNRIAEDLTGWDLSDAEGHFIEEVFRIENETTRMKVNNPALLALETGEIRELENHTLLIRKDGGEFPIEDSGAPIHNTEGELVGAVLVFRDVTEKKKSEEEVQKYQQHLEELVEQRTEALAMRIELERLVIEISSDLILLNEDTYEQGMNEALERVGQMLQLDGCGIYIMDRSGEVPVSRPEFLWALDESMRGQLAVERQVGEEDFPKWAEQFSESNFIAIDSVSHLPEGALSEKALLETMGVESLVVLSLGNSVPPMWTLTFYSRMARAWNDDDIVMFQMLSEVLNNVMERRKMEVQQRTLREQLGQAQKLEAIGKLTGGIAHDFNNMLVPILGYADAVLSGKQADSSRNDVLEIRKAAESAASLTKQLLAFSRKQILNKKPLSLNDLIRNMNQLLARVLGEDISFHLDLDESALPVEADKSQLEQVLLNLCVNARDAMVLGGDLHIRTFSGLCAEDKQKTFFEVKDTGCGIDHKLLGKIFDPFFTTKGMEGTGLGLSVVLGVADQHNGTVEVTSNPGEGTSFLVGLPSSLCVVEEAKVQNTPRRISRGEGQRILLVEDEPAVLRFVSRALRNHGYTVETAERKNAAIETFDRNNGEFDMIFTDAKLPDGTGIEVLEYVLDANPNLPALISSGYTDDRALIDQARKRGVEFLPKPYALELLHETVSRIIDGSKRSSAEEIALPG